MNAETTKPEPQFAVIPWNAENRYLVANVVRWFARKHDAERFCDRDYHAGNAGNYVVRPRSFLIGSP